MAQTPNDIAREVIVKQIGTLTLANAELVATNLALNAQLKAVADELKVTKAKLAEAEKMADASLLVAQQATSPEAINGEAKH